MTTGDSPPRSDPAAGIAASGQAQPTTEVPIEVNALEASDGNTEVGGVLHGHAWSPTGSRTLSTVAETREALADQACRVWIDLRDADPPVLADLADCLGLHPLIVEDIIERNQRAKVDVAGDTMHLVMFALAYEGRLETVELDIVLGPRYLLTSHPAGWRPHEMENIRRLGVDHFLSQGPDFLLYAVVDALVDGYFPVMDSLGNQIDELEDEVVRRPTRPVVERLLRAAEGPSCRFATPSARSARSSTSSPTARRR